MVRAMARLAVVPLAVAVAGMGACTILPGGDEDPPADPPATTSSGVGQAGPGEQSVPAGQPSGVLVSRDFQVEGNELRVDVVSLQRQGQTALLVWVITNTADQGTMRVGKFGEPDGRMVKRTTLVDPVAGKRYLVARSGGEEGECACSHDFASVALEPDESTEFHAVFAAPPPEVTQVNVDIYGVGVIVDAPVS